MIKDLIINERPYEKCLKYGAEYLSDAELLAVILRTGTKGESAIELAGKILNSTVNKGLKGLYNMTSSQLRSIKGIGSAKAVQIQCICELSKRIAKQRAAERLNFSSAATIADYYMEDLRHLAREHLMLIMLDNKCNLIKDSVITIGTINASLISTREVFLEAFRNNAYYIVLIHNHPSGNPNPSNSDLEVTRDIKNAGDLLGISLVDHIIIGDNSYVSFKEYNYI